MPDISPALYGFEPGKFLLVSPRSVHDFRHSFLVELWLDSLFYQKPITKQDVTLAQDIPKHELSGAYQYTKGLPATPIHALKNKGFL